MAAISNEAAFITCDAGVEGDVEGRTNKVNEGLWHTKVSISVQGVREIC